MSAGLEKHQIVFSHMAREEEFLAMSLAADVFLDTPPCNAHTTATYSCACSAFLLVLLLLQADFVACLHMYVCIHAHTTATYSCACSAFLLVIVLLQAGLVA